MYSKGKGFLQDFISSRDGPVTYYLMEGNIGGNYIVWFHEKIIGILIAELTIAFLRAELPFLR